MSMTMEQVVSQLQQEFVHAESSSGCRIWIRRRSASDQQSRDSSSSERHSESHRCERPWSSEGILWQRGGFSTVVEEDGGILRLCDQGV